MSYLRTFGPRADPATALLWGLIALSLIVVSIFVVLVPLGVLARRARGDVANLGSIPARAGPTGFAWFYVGMTLTVVALTGALVWTVAALAMIDSPPTPPRLTLDVIAHQWWWEVRYPRPGGGHFFVANEIHIPTGTPVAIRLASPDVIHSFWAPGLTGKTDAIPGQINLTWLQADRPGAYRGQCAEFCGLQHSHMGFEVIAEAPAAFKAWARNQARPAAPPMDAEAARGERVFVAHCGGCHAIQGTAAKGVVAIPAPAGAVPAPDLTHVMSRRFLAADTIPNTIGGLSGWIANPQALKPGAHMPRTYLSGPQLTAVVHYLETLR
jgi:cytochrome c oxidase subunit 2